MKTQIFISLRILGMMILLSGILYPLFITGIAQVCFHDKSNGSLLKKNGVIIGSTLIGQQFDNKAYFTSRPSASGYNTLPSGASNLSLTSKKLHEQVIQRKKEFIAVNKLPSNQIIPPEMLFASGSGLDPHISPQAALLQMERIAGARNFSNEQKQKLKKIIENNTEKPLWNWLGKTKVNVLLLNLQLDEIK